MVKSRLTRITKHAARWLVAASFLIFGLSNGSWATFDDTERRRVAKTIVERFLKAVQDDDAQAIQSLEDEFASRARQEAANIETRVSRMRAQRPRLVNAAIESPIKDNDHSFLLRGEPGPFLISVVFNPKEHLKFDTLLIQPTQSMGVPITAEQRREMIEKVAELVGDQYVYPETGNKMRDYLLSKAKANGYDSLVDDFSLASQLTFDLRSVSMDKHLGLIIEPESENRKQIGPDPRDIMGNNLGIRHVEVLDGNIGYFRLDAFVDGEEAKRKIELSLELLKDCDSMIIDLRTNGGGHGEVVLFVESYFFREATAVSEVVDRNGKVVESGVTTPLPESKQFLVDKPIVFLTSSRTFSAAEALCYEMQGLGRATVIGEQTGGGAHMLKSLRLSPRVVMALPFLRARSVATKSNWERTGVKPDIITTSQEAIGRAIQYLKQNK